MTLWVEQLSVRHGVLGRTRFDSLPVRVGRSYACDVLIDAAVAAPEHLEITLDGEGKPRVRALGESTFTLEGHPGTSREASVDANTLIRVGHCLLRVRTGQDLVEASDLPPEYHSRRQRLRRFAWAAVPAVAAVALNAGGKWLGSTDGDFWPALITTGFWHLVLIVAWVSICAMVAYALHHDGRWLRMLRLAGGCMLGLALVHFVLPVLAAAFNLGNGLRLGQFFVPFIMCVGVLASLRIMLQRREGNFPHILAGGLIACAIAGVSSYQQYHGQASRALPEISRMLPPALQFVPSQKREQVFKTLAGLEKNLAASRTLPIPDEVR